MARHFLDKSLQVQAAGFKRILFPANQNLGRFGRALIYRPCARTFRSLTITSFTSLG